MSEKKVILVTSVASFWGAQVAARLATGDSHHVVGLDTRQPAREGNGVDFVLAYVRNPLLVDLL